MSGAYVLINTISGMEKGVLEAVAEIPYVVSVEGVYGDFDMIARIEVIGNDSIDSILSRIRKVNGIKATRTVVSIEGERRSGRGMDHLGAPSD